MKASRKIEGVVEAVRLAPDGNVTLVRVYERLGAAFSDHKLLTRAEFLERLKTGKLYMTAKRTELRGFTFEPGVEIHLAQENGRDVLTTGAAGGQGDHLKGVPVF